eukprot:SAG31_NODE_3306_length_4437_cov_46.404564_2_plen_169_part_00
MSGALAHRRPSEMRGAAAVALKHCRLPLRRGCQFAEARRSERRWIAAGPDYEGKTSQRYLKVSQHISQVAELKRRLEASENTIADLERQIEQQRLSVLASHGDSRPNGAGHRIQGALARQHTRVHSIGFDGAIRRRRFRILSLDGGGVRGMFTARVLARLLKAEPRLL